MYDRRAIFLRAWEIVRQPNKFLADKPLSRRLQLALRRAWNEAKTAAAHEAYRVAAEADPQRAAAVVALAVAEAAERMTPQARTELSEARARIAA